ncbi:ribose-phosphate diphosphokinase [Nanoarchaeota archaeon]
MIISLSGNPSVGKKVARLSKKSFQQITTDRFPDGELYLRFPKKVPRENLIFIQSFHGYINDKFIETIFAAKSAKNGRKLTLIATYFPYLRQDKEFKPGEIVSNELSAELISSVFDEIAIFDPHLHREKTLSHIFPIKAHKLTANSLIAEYIRKNIKNPFIIGPDWESYKWAEKVAEMINCPSAILRKKRISSRKVNVYLTKKIDLKNKNVVIVDDMISTGHTLLEAIKDLKSIGAKKITCIAVHGIFVENALKKLRKAGAKVITTNTIPNSTAKIDVSKLIVDHLKKRN